jgi:hypothetical protein
MWFNSDDLKYGCWLFGLVCAVLGWLGITGLLWLGGHVHIVWR